MRRLITLSLTLVLASGIFACKPDEPVDSPPDISPGITDPTGPGNTVTDPVDPPQTPPDAPATSGISDAIMSLPDPQAVQEIWSSLDGYWVSSDGLYIGFVTEGDAHYIVYGSWEGVNQGWGELANSQATDNNQATFTVHYEAMPATETSGARASHDTYVMLDAQSYAADSTINILIADQGNGGWYKYSFGGKTADEARS